VSLLDKVEYIEVQIRHKDASPGIHYKVRTILTKALNKACGHLRLQNKHLLFGFYCQCGGVSEKHLAMLPRQFDSSTKLLICEYDKLQLAIEQAVWLKQSQVNFQL